MQGVLRGILLPMLLLAAPLVISVAASAAPMAEVAQFDITHYGAKPGGSKGPVCTAAIHAAVAAAAKAAPAEVVVPEGTFLTGSFGLASGVKLRLNKGAVLLGSTQAKDYPTAGWRSPMQGWNWDPALIDVANATDTGIVGEGAIDGQQMLWVKGYDPKNNFLQPIVWEKVNGCQGECRPKLVRFTDCNRVSIIGVTLRNSPDWTQLYRRCVNVLLQGITVTGSQLWGNNDGVDFESGAGIKVLDSYFRTGDDGIVFASGNTNQNRVNSPGLPLTDVVVRNCTISSKSSAIKWEAIDYGGCDHGTLADMLIEDVTIWNSSRGIGFQQRNGRGDFRNITVRRARINTIYPTGTNWWGSGEPIWLTNIPSAAKEGEPGSLGTIRNVRFEDIVIESENGVLISGVGRPVGPITFKNVSVTIAVLGNATCRKGYPGTPAGCSDYRPLNCQKSGSAKYCPDTPPGGVVLPQLTSGIRIEGAGSVGFEDVSVAYRSPVGGMRPAWWAEVCVTKTQLNYSFDPWPYPQNMTATGPQVSCTKQSES